ncbi:hypothetical protein Droror1_Dr00001595 [Drosera rotundifolia]
MNWSQQIGAVYVDNSAPYYSVGSFMDFFEGFTFDHVNFIFSGGSHMQENGYPPLNMGSYKFGYMEPVCSQYFFDGQSYWAHESQGTTDDYRMPSSESPATATNHQTRTVTQQTVANTNTHTSARGNNIPHDYQVFVPDNIDLDNMTYEELLELGETVGSQSRGLSQDLISRLPVSKFKCRFFLRKKSRTQRCVICQMEYRRGERVITLPCKHKYHVDCGSKWLGINKACPICYTEVCFDTAEAKE